MFLCSGVPGNNCKSIPVPISQFDTYHECAYFGYDYSSTLLREFSPDFIDQYRKTIIKLSTESKNSIIIFQQENNKLFNILIVNVNNAKG